MAGGGVNDLHTVWRDEWLGGEQPSVMHCCRLKCIIENMT
jgi:hypothetical protein